MARILSLTGDVRNALLNRRRAVDKANGCAKSDDAKGALGWGRSAQAAADRAVERAIEDGKKIEADVDSRPGDSSMGGHCDYGADEH